MCDLTSSQSATYMDVWHLEDSEINIMKFLDYLDCQAQKSGDRLLSIIGNQQSDYGIC